VKIEEGTEGVKRRKSASVILKRNLGGNKGLSISEMWFYPFLDLGLSLTLVTLPQ